MVFQDKFRIGKQVDNLTKHCHTSIDVTSLGNRLLDPVESAGYKVVGFQLKSTGTTATTARIVPVFSVDGVNWFRSGHTERIPIDTLIRFATACFPYVSLEVVTAEGGVGEISVNVVLDTQKVDVLEESTPTGLLQGGLLSVGTSDQVDVTQGCGVVVDSHNDGELPSFRAIYWDDQSVDIPLSGTATVHVYIAPNGIAFGSSGDDPDPDAARLNIFLGRAAVDTTANDLIAVNSRPNVAGSISHMAYDFIGDTVSRIGVDIEPEGGSLALESTRGFILATGVNWQSDRANPNILPVAARAPLEFDYYLADGTVHSSANTVIDPESYELDGAGTVSTVSGGPTRSTIQRFWGLFDGTVIGLFGQTVYNSLEEALDSYAVDTQGSTWPSWFDQVGLFLGAVVVINSAVDLSETLEAAVIVGDRGVFGRALTTSGDVEKKGVGINTALASAESLMSLRAGAAPFARVTADVQDINGAVSDNEVEWNNAPANSEERIFDVGGLPSQYVYVKYPGNYEVSLNLPYDISADGYLAKLKLEVDGVVLDARWIGTYNNQGVNRYGAFIISNYIVENVVASTASPAGFRVLIDRVGGSSSVELFADEGYMTIRRVGSSA